MNPSSPGSRRLRLGLHIDNSAPTAPWERSHSPNRLAVNIGREDRYLLIINQPIQSLLEALGELPPNKRSDPEHIALEFMRAFPNYPVTRLLIRPGEAYIAPTDNVIHDGSTTCATVPSASVHIIGDFGMPRAHASET